MPIDHATRPTATTRTHRWARRARWLPLVLAALLVAAACETTPEDRTFVLDLINDSRAAAGRAPVVSQADVDAEADRWARHLRDTCTLAHRPDLRTNIPAGWTAIAENVGWASRLPGESDEVVLQRVHAGFMGSSGHRANILGASYDWVGIGAVQGDCPNVAGSQPEYWVVHIFVARP